ncbi:MAG: response regulator [Deltaproteobacteria bacterium]|nr:response regulator [Deltaproteobacteria bacterium]
MKKILVVDNDPGMLKFMTNLLERKGHEVLTAGDGLSALDILETYIPDVMFVDLIMPNIGGEKLCSIIRSRPELQNVYLIVLSAIAAEESTHFTEFGAHAYITKGPFNKMGEHVLAALEQSDKGASNDLPKVIGVENLRGREIVEELLTSKKHSEVILHNMTEAILELTLEGRIISANPAATLLTGISEEKLLASSFTELFHDTHRKTVEGLLATIGDAPHTINEDSPVIVNGKQVSLSILPVKDEEDKSIVVILDDITERKRAEQELRQSEKRMEVLKFANHIALKLMHELRNPLTAIGGFSARISGRDPPEDKVKEYARIIFQESSRLDKALIDVLAHLKTTSEHV